MDTVCMRTYSQCNVWQSGGVAVNFSSFYNVQCVLLSGWHCHGAVEMQ